MRYLRAGVFGAFFALWTVFLLPIQLLAVRLHRTALGRRTGEIVPVVYHRGLLCGLGLKVCVEGPVSFARPTLFVGNHVSWLDIVVLASVLKAAFIAKYEVARWPLLGVLARAHRTVFIERKRRRTADHSDEMTARLGAGDSLILFPEGTSSDGMRVLPFKSAFFVLAERALPSGPLPVQPFSIVYRRLDNMPVGRRWMPLFAWVGDEDLISHLWRYLAHSSAEVVVRFHPPVTSAQFASRKALAAHCYRVIAEAMSDIHTGRSPAPAPPAAVAVLD